MLRGRILHCIPTMGGGGAERQCAYLVTELIRMGWQIDVALWAGGANLERLEASGARIHWLKGLNQFDPRLGWQVLRIISGIRPDLVQTWTGAMDIAGGLACRVRSVPWLISERAPSAWGPAWLGYMRSRLRLAVARGASAVVSNSASAARTWTPYLPRRTPCHVIRNALPIAEIQQVEPAARSGPKTGEGLKEIIAVGRFSPEKNWNVLIDAMPHVLQEVPAAVTFYGIGRGRSQVERRIRQHGLSGRIALPGYVDDAWARMKSADVMVNISRVEGCPNVVLEAMACGCPLVVSDIPPHRELLDADAAIIVDPADPRALADAIVRALAEPDKSRRRAQRAQALAEQWTPSFIGGQYGDLYRDILTRGRA